MPMQPLDIEKIIFWGLTLLIAQNVIVIFKLIQMNPKKIYDNITVKIPKSNRTLKAIFDHDNNKQKFNLVLWHLKIRDIFATLSLFTGIFMVGGYVTYYLQLFTMDKPKVITVAGINGFVLLLFTLRKIKCQHECVAFDKPDLANHIKAGHY